MVNTVSVSGGGAPAASAETSTTVGGDPQFGLLGFTFQPSSVLGAVDGQAGDHPYALTTTQDFPEGVVYQSGLPGAPIEMPRDIEIELPQGLIGDVQAASRCTEADVFAKTCRADSQVGVFTGNFEQGFFAGYKEFPIYNVVPERGYPAEFGFFAEGVNRPVFLYANVGPAPAYNIHVSAPDVVLAAEVRHVIASFYGRPQERDGETGFPTPFLTNPSACDTGQQTTSAKVYTWEGINAVEPVEATFAAPPVVGCANLRFAAELSLAPEDHTAGEPSGGVFDLKVHQAPAEPEALATPPVKNLTVALPPGATINPAAAGGLAACPANGPDGIDLTGPESREKGPDGAMRNAPGHCPSASQIGTVEASTPLLAEPLQGHVYIAAPGCGGEGQRPCENVDALDGNLYGIYLELEGSGVVLKLHGAISADPATGRLTATFQNLPQDPVSDVKLTLKSGQRAPLANPQTCGETLLQADLTPWSAPETPDSRPSSKLLTEGCTGPVFEPSFASGTTSTEAGAYTELVTTVSRTDHMQDLGQIQVQTPPGLLGTLSHVTPCPEPLAARGACGSAAEVGTVAASAGAGSEPYWTTGKVYLTGPYRGAPYGLSIVVPAKAGPFNLGTIVTRATIAVNPTTTALTVTSDPLPQIIDGVPLRVQTVNVTINRAQFIFNPTNCTALRISGTISSAQGTAAGVSSPFAAGGCRNLPFDPIFAPSTRKPVSKLSGAELDAKVTATPGQANVQSFLIDFPKQLPSRLKTIQKACIDTVFEANPAACPPQSLIGVARAITPVLITPATGPVYLVSHGGAAFPDVDMVLQSEDLRADLTGAINISKRGITSVDLAHVPDVPFSSFDVQTPEGPYSALTTDGSLCAKALAIPTTIIGQNGKRIQRNVKIAVSGCPKAKKKKQAKARNGRSSRSGSGR